MVNTDIAPVTQPLCTPILLPTTYRCPIKVLEEEKGAIWGNPEISLPSKRVEEEARKKRFIDLGNSTEVTLGVVIYSRVKPNFLGTTLTRRFRNSRIVRN